MLAIEARAQPGTTYQVFLPGGRLPTRELRISLQTGAREKRSISTDAKGAFRLPADLAEVFRLTLRIEGDKTSFADVTLQLLPNSRATLAPIFLPPLPAAAQAAPPLVEDAPDVDYFDARAPAEAQTARDAALQASRENDAEKTIALFTQAIIHYPSYLRAINELGLFYYQQNRLEEAGFAFTQAASIRSRFPYPRLNLAQTRMRQGNGGEAHLMLRALLIDFPGFLVGRVAYADLLMRSKQFDEAAIEYKLLLTDPKLEPVKRADARMNLGLIAHREERYKGAVREFTQALADGGTWPNEAQTHLYLGNALQALQKIAEAERAYLKAYEIGGKPMAIAQALLGQLYFEQQKYDLALRAFEQVLKDAPANADTPKIREQIEKVKAAMKK
jgi:tetratricopeptide (TPR) repeat protein